MLLLAAYQVLLHRYTGQEDIVVGSPAAGRTRSEFHSLVGYFVNPVVFRTSLAGDPQFSELLVRTRRIVLDGLANQDFPFPILVQRLHPPRDPSRSPIFQVMFVSQQAPRLIGLPFRPAVEPVDIPQRLGQFDLVLESVQEGDGVGGSDASQSLPRTEPGRLGNLRFNFEYNPDLFDKATIVRMSDHLGSLFQGIVSNPSARISRLSLLSAGEIRQRLEGSRGAENRPCSPGCVHHWFETIALERANDIAVVSGSKEITYGSLNTRANMLAHYLCHQGIGAEMLIAICLPPCIEMIVAVLGVLKAGAAYLPLDPGDPDTRLSDLLRHAEPAAIVATHEFESRNVRNTPRRISVDGAAGGEQTTWNPGVNISDSTLAYVIYTSGSTGTPEAVAVEHRQIANYVHAASNRYEWKPGLNFAMVQPLTWDGCLTMFFGSLCTGGTLHLISQETALNASALACYFTSHRIDCAKFTPSHFTALDSTGTPDLMPRSCLILGGEGFHSELAHELQARAPDCRIYNGYGPTETTVAALTYRFDPMKQARSGDLLPLGHPLANITAYVLDQYLQLCPIGVTGEICIGGAGVARCYLKNKNSTSAKFVADPFSKQTGARIFRSGDRGRILADGSIEFAGRVDDQLKIRGLRVEPREIELAISRHPYVRQTLVVGRGEPTGRIRLVAYIVADSVGRLSSRQLREFLSQRLPAYMCPSSFIFLDALPLRKNGKVDRSALPVPDDTGALSSVALTPRSETEELISRIWRECLGIPVVLPDDNFFDIGGDSLLLIRVHNRLEEAFGATLSVLELFEYATVSSLAEHLRSKRYITEPLKEGHARGKMREDSRRFLEDGSDIRTQHRTANPP